MKYKLIFILVLLIAVISHSNKNEKAINNDNFAKSFLVRKQIDIDTFCSLIFQNKNISKIEVQTDKANTKFCFDKLDCNLYSIKSFSFETSIPFNCESFKKFKNLQNANITFYLNYKDSLSCVSNFLKYNNKIEKLFINLDFLSIQIDDERERDSLGLIIDNLRAKNGNRIMQILAMKNLEMLNHLELNMNIDSIPSIFF